MKDQAAQLRLLAKKMNIKSEEPPETKNKHIRVITIASGKGGVGKSNIAVNLAISLTKLKKNVVLLDADLGLANIDIILGIMPQYNLSHVISGEKTVKEIIYDGPQGINVIAGGSGVHQLANLRDHQLDYLVKELNLLEEYGEYLLVDTGAGLSQIVLSFILAAEEIILVCINEPTSITDTYGTIKTIRQHGYKDKINIIVNRVKNNDEARDVYNKLRFASNKFLNCSIEYLGVVREDNQVSQAVRNQKPLIIGTPHSRAGQDIYKIAMDLSNSRDPSNLSKAKMYFNKFADYFRQV